MWSMCRNKHFRPACFLMSILTCTALSACSVPAVFSETGADTSAQVDLSGYLDVSLLEQSGGQASSYKTYVLEYGTFATPAREATYYRTYYGMIPVRARIEQGSMNFVKYVVSSYDSVTAGTEVAQVETEVDPLDIQEARLQLERMQERYQEAQADFLEQQEEDLEENYKLTNKHERQAGRYLMERNLLEWEHTSRNYERQISDLQEKVSLLEKSAAASYITAPSDGEILLTTFPKGALEDGQIIAYLFSLEDVFFFASDDFGLYRYGMDFNWDINIGNTKVAQMTGGVVTGTAADLYGNLNQNAVIFQAFPADKVPLEEYTSKMDSGKIIGNLETMENVLLVPSKAVTVEDGIAYVTVVKEDGRLLKTGFKPGGSNSDYYWVLSGLEEGTVVLLEE